MGQVVPFTSNIEDLSTQDGYQFEFRCMRCSNGYRSSFHRSMFGFGGKIAAIGGGLLGGSVGGEVERAGWDSTWMNQGGGSPTKDKELAKAANEVKEHFYQCNRCGKWVCKEICWNEERGMCVDDAPKVQEEIGYMQAQAQRDQLQEKIAAQDLTQGVNYTDQATGLCPACHQESGGGKFCQKCGAALAAAPAATKKFCTNCGTELVGGIKFCSECGTPAVAS
jgi:hypothetical protein